MSSPSALRWRSVPSDAIVWREWDGEFVVRNERSGSTHLLGPLGGSVLQVLLKADGALSVADISGRLGESAAAAAPDQYAAIDAVLSEFKRLGLAEPEAQ
ncbi:MAG TPA: HPr-rel-A system PqqD family peptide chaperone [Burkholderiales bacterium]|jgi:PqqD family protein of HPr-rel-A system|nr:HPr-rel-A system PqqD family peptide chaperone [Burkholderiales bacterium]